ncbi:putative membrane protein [Bacteriovorax sp. DB6_IX]|nr:putative membrane protein [Bacteriovorax sp. DB6_IX]
MEMAQFFLLSLGFGVFIFAPVAKSEMTGGGFQKLLTTVCLVSLFIAQICHVIGGKSATDLHSIVLYISMVSMLFHRQLHETFDKKNAALWIMYSIPALLTFVAFYTFLNSSIGNYFFILSSALYLGAITYAMILGHWYLVTPKLSERPLKIALIFTWILFAPKLIWSGIEVVGAGEYLELGTRLGGGYAFNWLMVSMRGLWGYLVIIVMSIFGWKLVAMRSIQSATGIFYAMTIFVFIGEMISSFLFFKYGLLI